MEILIPIVSALIAAFLAHYLAESRMRKADLLKFQIQSYSDFLAASAKLATARRTGDTSNENIDLASLNDAKSRVITCGDTEVVESLIIFWRKGGTLEKEQEILAYKSLINTIRTKLGHNKNESI